MRWLFLGFYNLCSVVGFSRVCKDTDKTACCQKSTTRWATLGVGFWVMCGSFANGALTIIGHLMNGCFVFNLF